MPKANQPNLGRQMAIAGPTPGGRMLYSFISNARWAGPTSMATPRSAVIRTTDSVRQTFFYFKKTLITRSANRR
jgi:hypothetical protein